MEQKASNGKYARFRCRSTSFGTTRSLGFKSCYFDQLKIATTTEPDMGDETPYRRSIKVGILQSTPAIVFFWALTQSRLAQRNSVSARSRQKIMMRSV